MKLIASAALALSCAPAFSSDLSVGHVFQSVVPALPYTSSCRSRTVLLNIGDAPVKVEVEGHAETGALVPQSGHATRTWLGPDEQVEYRLQMEGQSECSWIKVREYVPDGLDSPAIAIRPASECVVGNELRSTTRQVAFPCGVPGSPALLPIFMAQASGWSTSPTDPRTLLPAIRPEATTYFHEGQGQNVKRRHPSPPQSVLRRKKFRSLPLPPVNFRRSATAICTSRCTPKAQPSSCRLCGPSIPACTFTQLIRRLRS